MAHLAPIRSRKRHQRNVPRQEGTDAASELSVKLGSPDAGGFPTSTSSSSSESSSSSSASSFTTSQEPEPATTSSSTSLHLSSTSKTLSSSSATTSTSRSSRTSSSTSSTPSMGSSSSIRLKASKATSSFSTVTLFAPTLQLTVSGTLTSFVVVPSTTISDGQSMLPSETAQTNSSLTFLQNKAAMAGTFSVVGLVGAGVLLFVLISLWKKRLAFISRSGIMRDSGGSFKNFTMVEPEKAESSNGHNSYHSHGDYPISDLGLHTPLDPFATNIPAYPPIVHYGSAQDAANPFTDPTPLHLNYSGQSLDQSLRDDPHLTYATNLDMPPPPSRQAVVRSSAQPSIDSFYGAAY